MTAYREILYRNYHSTQENRNEENDGMLFEEQVNYFSNGIIPLFPEDKNAKILEIGCGNGALIRAAFKSGYTQMTGIDLSEQQIEKARLFGIDHTFCIDAKSYLRDKEATFDMILAMDVIEHFTKDELVEMLAIIRKSLKPGGMVLFRTPNMDAPLTSVYSFGDFTHECLLNKSSAMQVMLSSGFVQVEVLPSQMTVSPLIKEWIRKILWFCFELRFKLLLFSSGRTWNDVLFTPNLVIRARK